MDKLKMHTPNLADENYKKLSSMFPNAITETINENGEVVHAIDVDILQQEISGTVVAGGGVERYQFTWPDKKKSVVLANQPIAKTLRLDRGKSIGRDGTQGSIDTQNIYIEGDNLEVLKLLQETYLKKIKMIYIDPPYNTGKNYIYHNDFHTNRSDYLQQDGQFDSDGNRLTVNLLTNGRFHTDWMNMMYPRLRIARDLLSSDGILVCAIDENEFATLSIMLKEIFSETGYEFAYTTVIHNPRGQQGLNFSYVNEYAIIVFPKNGKKYLADVPKKEIDSRGLRDSGTESDRTDARNCFYPFFVKDNKIIGVGEVPANDFHPASANVERTDGIFEVWQMTDDGSEKKWRYARQSIEKVISKLSVKRGRNSFQIIFNKDTETMRSVMSGARYDASEYGTKIVQSLLAIKDGFSFPKSLWLVYDLIKLGCENDRDAIVLDFFSGSGTTAHALMELNKDDGGNRKYIMVQINEPCGEETGANIAGYQTICDIGEERIRRAGKKIKEEHPNVNIDIGFRVFKVDSSNMKNVYYKPNDYSQDQIDLLASNIKDDRTPEDLLFQTMLDLGIPLSSTIHEEMINGKKVFVVGNEYTDSKGIICTHLIACFDDSITDDAVKAIAEKHPAYAVFRDSGMANDSVATNFEQIFETYSPKTVRKVF